MNGNNVLEIKALKQNIMRYQPLFELIVLANSECMDISVWLIAASSSL